MNRSRLADQCEPVHPPLDLGSAGRVLPRFLKLCGSSFEPFEPFCARLSHVSAGPAGNLYCQLSFDSLLVFKAWFAISGSLGIWPFTQGRRGMGVAQFCESSSRKL